MGVSQILICALVSQRLLGHGEESVDHREQDVSMTRNLFGDHCWIFAVGHIRDLPSVAIIAESLLAWRGSAQVMAVHLE